MAKKVSPWMPKKESGEEFWIGPLRAIAPTKTAARELAIEVAGRLLADEYRPVVVRYRDMVGVAFRTPMEGTTYRIFWPDAPCDGLVEDGFATADPEWSLENAAASMRMHMAHQGHVQGETTCELFIEGSADAYDFARWANWQHTYAREYRLQIGRGIDNETADRMARDVANGFI
jgi:hypothetical protein